MPLIWEEVLLSTVTKNVVELQLFVVSEIIERSYEIRKQHYKCKLRKLACTYTVAIEV